MAITVAHPTPRSRATQATERFCSPTWRHASARARSVSYARGAMASARSVQLPVSQSASGQRQIRFHHTTTTRRPPEGRSRTRTLRRPLRHRPHSALGTGHDNAVGLHQLVQLAVDLGGHQQAEAVHPHQRDGAVASLEFHQGLLDSRCLGQPQESRGPGSRWWMGLALCRGARPDHAPRFSAKSPFCLSVLFTCVRVSVAVHTTGARGDNHDNHHGRLGACFAPRPCGHRGATPWCLIRRRPGAPSPTTSSAGGSRPATSPPEASSLARCWETRRRAVPVVLPDPHQRPDGPT